MSDFNLLRRILIVLFSIRFAFSTSLLTASLP
jgi:hypothetical protein